MDDAGFTLTGLAISGTALTALGGIVGAWIKAKYSTTTIKPQPFEVKETPVAYNFQICEERHKRLDGQIDCLFAGINQQRATAGKVDSIEKQVDRMDTKLDTIIGQLAHQKGGN